MSYRLDDIDCVSARGHAALGGTLAIQAVWSYDRPVDMAALREFHVALRRGRLGRVVLPALIPAAGDRWSTRGEFGPLEVADAPIPQAARGAWIAEQARAELRTYGGPAYRLASATMDNGESVVSLLVSHTIADARALCAAIAEAVAGKELDPTYPSDEFGRARLFFDELGAAARRIRPMLGAAVLGTRLAITGRRAASAGAQGQDAGLPTITVTVPAHEWHAAARARGGSSTALAVALLAEVATAVGRTDEAGKVVLMMPVSTRTETDERANALAAIDFEVDLRDGAPADLAGLRAVLKAKLRAAAEAGHRVPPLIPQAVALPRRLYGVLARQTAAAPTVTVCSNLGEVDPAVLCVDGQPASSFEIGLVNQSLHTRGVLDERGGNLYALMSESGGAITLRVNGYHPPRLRTVEELTELCTLALARYELSATCA